MLGVLVASFLLALIFTVLLNRASDRVIWQSCQPESVNYDSYSGCLFVGEGNLDWSRFPYTLNRRYYFVLGVTPTHGHYKEYSFTPISIVEDIETYIKKSQLEWTDQGLTFIEESGHRFFFPKEYLGLSR